ncbi:MAG: hypothetical protein KTR30_21735 [Saprospiraceae bacterium]|nr:hypothetical protein [Saprospiraceae bacterium]
MKKWLFLLLVVGVVFCSRRVGERGGNASDPSLHKDPCAQNEYSLGSVLNAYAAAIEAEPEKWMYSNTASDFKDCSGMFIRLCEKLDGQFCDAYQFPGRKYHSTRDLASWYAREGKLTLIKDAQSNQDLIQVGQVMFYGKANKRIPKRLRLADLTAPYPNGLLAHMGVVVAVNRMDDGTLRSYTLYHGRSSGKPASRSIIRMSQNADFGNWGQPWLATASILVK